MLTSKDGRDLRPALLADPTWWGTLAAARDLGSHGVPVTLAVDNPLAPARWSRHVARVTRFPGSAQPEPLLEWLLSFGRRSPGHVLYPTSDELAWLVSEHRDVLAADFRLFAPPLAALSRLLDKAQLSARAPAAGLSVPETWCPKDEREVEALARSARFPLYVKPRTQVFARGHGKGERVDRPDRLAPTWRKWQALARYPDLVARALPDAHLPLVQAGVGAAERIYTLDGFVGESGQLCGALACVKVLQRPRHSGPGICFEHAPVVPDLAAGLRTLLAEAGFFGVFDAEFVEQDGRLLLIDVNPRFYNHMAFEIERGLPLPWLAYLAAAGEPEAFCNAVLGAQRALLAGEGPRMYVHRLPLRLLTAAQTWSGGASEAERRRWRQWSSGRDGRFTDPALGAGDPWPAAAKVGSTAAGAGLCYAPREASFAHVRPTGGPTMRIPLALAAAVLLPLSATTADAAPAGESTVAIDVSKTRAPISKYVYGQFVEHLGRCIYGGLWAEMLEDRKFYYPVTGDAPAWEMVAGRQNTYEGEGVPYELLVRSPWMVLGEKKAVSMTTDRPFVGEHTPVVAADGKGTGLYQERLSLVGGRRYTGRVVLAGEAAAAPVRISLVWGGGASDRDTVVVERLGDDYATTPLAFTAGRSTDNGRLEIVALGQGRLRIGTASLMPADNVNGWRADTLARVRELSVPVLRWPGGNFVSGYDWKDGIGDPDRRPPRKNPAWKGIESNDVGIDEFMLLCRELGTEPYVAVNTGLGGVAGAAEEVEYTNGAPATKMGALRTANGHARPYAVKWWGIGNEMYGDWQLGHMPLADYVKKHVQVVDAMRKVDAPIVPIAVGAAGDWSRTMLANAAGHMGLMSEHTYWQSRPDVPAHVAQPVAAIRKIADAHRAYRRELPSLEGRDVRIALDEWNYWYGPNEYGELGTQYFLQDGLGAAAALHEMFRNSDLFFMANYAQMVNVIGAIKTSATAAELETTGLVQQLYRQHFGTTPVDVSGAPAPLDVAAALTEDGRALTVAVVNPTDESRSLRLQLAGGRVLTGAGRRFVVTGKDRFAHNRPGQPRQVDIVSETLAGGAETVAAPALSVTLYSLWLR